MIGRYSGLSFNPKRSKNGYMGKTRKEFGSVLCHTNQRPVVNIRWHNVQRGAHSVQYKLKSRNVNKNKTKTNKSKQSQETPTNTMWRKTNKAKKQERHPMDGNGQVALTRGRMKDDGGQAAASCEGRKPRRECEERRGKVTLLRRMASDVGSGRMERWKNGSRLCCRLLQPQTVSNFPSSVRSQVHNVLHRTFVSCTSPVPRISSICQSF
jgi:hypothetical protein